MTNKNILIGTVLIIGVLVVGYFFFPTFFLLSTRTQDLDPRPKNMTLSGNYVCLPHINPEGPQTMECAFGLKTDDGVYYAVNFGSSSDSFSKFKSGSHITAEGFVVIKEALSSSEWAKYNMKGIFTITKIISSSPSQAKINIDAVCNQALAYMSFPDSKSAETFVKDCKDGKHPEVVEKYISDLNLGEGVAI